MYDADEYKKERRKYKKFANERLGIIAPENVMQYQSDSDRDWYFHMIGMSVDVFSTSFSRYPLLWMYLHDLKIKHTVSNSDSSYLDSVYHLLDPECKNFNLETSNGDKENDKIINDFFELRSFYFGIDRYHSSKLKDIEAKEEFIRAFMGSEVYDFFKDKGFTEKEFKNFNGGTSFPFQVYSRICSVYPEKYLNQMKKTMSEKDNMERYNHVLHRRKTIMTIKTAAIIIVLGSLGSLILFLLVKCSIFVFS